MAQAAHSPPAKGSTSRPRGILKNPSFTQSADHEATSPASPVDSPTLQRGVSDKDLTLQNTLSNAGHRRSSSSVARATLARRRSSQSASSREGAITQDDDESAHPEQNPGIKWDEANLYLTEQQKSSTMKINEPKTPYTRHYDPAEDEEELHRLDAEELMVDELDNKLELPEGSQKAGKSSRRTRESDIPGLDIGEPEEPYPEPVGGETMKRGDSSRGREKSVVVTPDIGHAGGDELAGMTSEEKKKHLEFEKKRRQHYEMRDVKDLLGHPEMVDEMDEDEDGDAPPLPIRGGPAASAPTATTASAGGFNGV